MKSTRWCIIGGPRTGSTWLESLISKPLRPQPNFIQLSEFFEYSNQLNFKLDEINNLMLINESSSITDPQELFSSRLEMITQANNDQCAVMKLFLKPYNFPNLNYIDLLHTLKKYNFKFLVIKRNILDRAVSWYLANYTKVMHKSIVRGKIILSTQDRGRIEGNVNIDNITVDINQFKDLYSLLLQEAPILNQLITEFNIPTIHYSTLTQDLSLHKIPFGWSNLLKLYTLPHNEFITNYNDVIDAANFLNIEHNYEH